MKILLISHFSNSRYSGGRFVAWNLACSIIQGANNILEIWTNQKPIYHKEYENYNLDLSKIKYDLSLNYKVKKKGDYDLIILIPENTRSTIHKKAILNSKLNSCRLIMYNFETPNWYNSLSKHKRSENLWEDWKLSGHFSDGILSISKSSKKYAIDYYGEGNHDYWYPPINSFVANKILKSKIKKEDQILFITRFGTHKQDDKFLELYSENLKGYRFKFLIGTGNIPEKIKLKLDDLSKKFEIENVFLQKVSEDVKFEELARSKCLYFPSQFEGLGIPPYEALYVKTIPFCFKLEVFQELSTDIKWINDDTDLNISQILEKEHPIDLNTIHENFEFYSAAKILNEKLKQLCSKPIKSKNEFKISSIKLILNETLYFISVVINKIKK